MTEQDVDELLADLDRVLAADVSPKVAAHVRTYMTKAPSVAWFGWQGYLAAAVIGVALIAAGYRMRSSLSDAPPLLVTPSKPASAMLTSEQIPLQGAPTPNVRPAPLRSRSISAKAVVQHSQEDVVISPDRRFALTNLMEALNKGVVADSLFAGAGSTVSAPMTQTPVVIEPLTIESITADTVTVGTEPDRASRAGGES